MSKRERSFSLKWKTTRVFPMDGFTNAMNLSETARYRMESLDEWMDAELRIHGRILRGMGCDEEKAKIAIAALRIAYESSQKVK